MRLYHGSDVAVTRPVVERNQGFADLGRGFYLTDDEDVARQRAVSRARRTGGTATVSVFEFDEHGLPWLTWGSEVVASSPMRVGEQLLGYGSEAIAASSTAYDGAFGLRFEASVAGIAAWASYIRFCRMGRTEVPGFDGPVAKRGVRAGFTDETEVADFGCPAVVRAWIATEEVEMICSMPALAKELAELIDPAGLVVQYCFADQAIIDQRLRFVEARA
ncbi:MAG: DUF3990 domain-containing protein [Atopobiaceae bacterium]|nr:DUF3990 domain-containing protein [Atopobiaceae bacterium]